MEPASDILDIVSSRRATGEPFALATVVRTVAATAAKAGAKAVILSDGTISEGWIGGGCARAAVLQAAREALLDGKPRLVSVQPPELLNEQGFASNEERQGVRFVKNMCPSQGTMDIFVEPVLPHPQIVICGSSPVAAAIAELARRIGFVVTVCAPAAEQANFTEVDRRIEGFEVPNDKGARRFVRDFDARSRRRSGIARSPRGRGGVCGLCRQPQKSRSAQGQALGRRIPTRQAG